MPSLSPSPRKRLSLPERNSSTHSLSSSGKPPIQKTPRTHVAGKGHSRNLSHGKTQTKLGKVNSSTALAADASRPSHQRKKSGATSPPASPKAFHVKRNASHVVLPKTTSHANLRRNQSANVLGRNPSHLALKKLGLPPAPRAQEKSKAKDYGGFELGSTDEEDDEGEWEDSTTQSPEATRDHSKASTPVRVATPPRHVQKPPDLQPGRQDKTSSPPAPVLQNQYRSAPNLTSTAAVNHGRHQQLTDLALRQQNPRSSRAPPAMSSISAHAAPAHLLRNDSSKSFTKVTIADAQSPPTHAGTSGGGTSSIEAGVSHFLPPSSMGVSQSSPVASDDDAPNEFLPNYHPMPSQSPEKATSTKSELADVPSRTQQRLELQRREAMRTGTTTASAPPAGGLAFSFGSAASLQSRPGSRGRNRSGTAEAKAIKRDEEAAAKQLGVVRRFRNPIVESVKRLKEHRVIPSETGVITPPGAQKGRPLSRRSPANQKKPTHPGLSRSYEDIDTSMMTRHPVGLGGGPGKGQLRRQGSHDDIGLSRSRRSDEDDPLPNEDAEGLSAEEALLRRIWDSREVYEPGDGDGAA